MTWIQQTLKYPEECYYNQKLPKKQVYENAELNTRDKKTFTKNIEEMALTYYFNTKTLNIPPYTDTTRRYTEIAIFEIQLRETTKLNRIADIILRFIPYPTLIIFEINEYIQLYASHIREHKSDTNKITLDEENGMIHTDWIKVLEPDTITNKLIQDLQLENLNNMNFYEFYKDIYNAILTYNGSRIKGQKTTLKPEQIKKILDKKRQREYQISIYKGQIDEETNFNEQVKINMKIKEIEKDLKKDLKKL
ncbi:DUF4391 domain-containing protein [Methanosphaera stadtmanae]|uniref:DUF4391 domain-containing protein n=1 Tax=Methanosphaera stadtmanae TaxID=2317 RepID=UPI002677663A|nr:DUF4391 domain-containing protein [Methanosphaera stadtmanae]